MPRRRRKNEQTPIRRVLPKVANLRLSVTNRILQKRQVVQNLDRRTFHPLGPDRPLRMTDTTIPSLISPKPGKGPAYRVSFADPSRTILCRQRNRRKQVLHALQKTGKGQGHKRPRRTQHSQISCKG